MPRLVRTTLLAALLVCAAHATAQTAGTLGRTTAIEIDGRPMQVDVYLPGAGEPVGYAIVAHGWTRSRERHRDAGRALAEAGVVAVIPDLPNVIDLWGNGSAIVELAQRLEQGALGLPPVERSSLVLIGTSAGGLATVLAGSKLPGIAGWVGLDPVDRTGTGMYAASKLDAPAIVLLGDASACNLFGSGRTLAWSVPHLLRTRKIEGASHCDFESPTNSFCTRMCGGSSREMQLAARNETVLAALELLAAARVARVGEARVAGGPGGAALALPAPAVAVPPSWTP
ncbi:hypothetical protein BURK1_02550 [Burkholderiales bacterium]|nr:hypothetical protein BURK1_02550 [Burkholderiales bacterium]